LKEPDFFRTDEQIETRNPRERRLTVADTKSAKSALEKMAAQRKADYARGPEGALEILEPFRSELDKEERQTFEAVVTKVTSLNEKGERHVQVTPGLAAGPYSEGSLIETNCRLVRPRANRLREIAKQIDLLILGLKYRPRETKIPDDVRAFVNELRESIPPLTREMETIQAPKTKKTK
jgi:hypothetical protein